MRKIIFKFFFVLIVLNIGILSTKAETITSKNFRFVEYPDFPEKHSTWGSIGYSKKFNRIVIGVTDHYDKIILYSYDPKTKKIEKGVDIVKAGNLVRPYQWQGKIHSQMIENNKDGWIYFSTDSGLERWVEYRGGYFMKYHPITQELVNLGKAAPGFALKDFGFDQVRQRMYGITSPKNYVFIKDLETNEVKNLGCFNKKYSGRVTFTDDWGNLYLADHNGHIIKYEASTDSIVISDKSLPSTAKDGETDWRQAYGFIAWARYKDTQTYYLMTYTHHILKFVPKEKGMGKWEDLGLSYTKSDVPRDVVIDHAYAPNLVCGDNHKLYYWVGGHRHYFFKDESVLIECDPKTKEKKIVYRVPTTKVLECTGSGIRDKNGNLYFAARRKAKGKNVGESGSSIPNLIVFNPEKNIQQ